MTRVAVHLDDSILEWVKRIAERASVKQAEAIRTALREGLKVVEKEMDRWE